MGRSSSPTANHGHGDQRPRCLLNCIGVVKRLRPDGLGNGVDRRPPAIAALTQIGEEVGAIRDPCGRERHATPSRDLAAALGL
jgi:hypothetical protein